jgi:flagellar basal-body rod protein FlgG
MRSLHIAATGMLAQQTNVETISNNLANMNTTGYKRRRAEFQDLIYQNLRRVGSQSSDTGTVLPSGAQVGLGVRTSAIYRISEQGNLQQTENRFDLAIRGNGYFQVQMPGGEVAYTRDGTFALSPEGVIVTSEGFVVNPGITIPAAARDVTINASGEVLASIDGRWRRRTSARSRPPSSPMRAGWRRWARTCSAPPAPPASPRPPPPASPATAA